MFSPVKLNGTYPALQADVGSVYGPTINGPTNGPAYRNGPVFGLNSLSEPNISPDVVTIQGHVVWPDKTQNPQIAHKSKHTFPNGTPVYVVTKKVNNKVRFDKHKEPIHKIYILDESKKGTKVDPGDLNGFLTVLVGTATFENNNKVSHCAVAVQNVSTVHLANSAFKYSARKNWMIGERLYLCVYDDSGETRFKFSDQMQTDTKVCRKLRLTATEVGGEIKCDLGEMSYAP